MNQILSGFTKIFFEDIPMPVIEAKEKEEMTYYMMNMPEWFINLPVEEKMSLAKEFAKDYPADEVLTKEKVVSLLLDT